MSRTETTAMLSKLVEKRLIGETLRTTYRLPRNIDQVLVPSKKGDKLIKLHDMTGNGSPSYRHRKCCTR